MINPNQSSSEYFVYILDLLKLEPLFECTYQDIYKCKDCNKIISKKDISYCPLINEDFKEFFETYEEIENFNCEECKQKKTIIHCKRISSLSNIVVVCLNKYFGKKMIEYPYEFDFSVKNEEEITEYKYRIIGTVEHIGNLNGGHYICRVRRGDRFYIADDMNIKDMQEMQGNSSENSKENNENNKNKMHSVCETYMVFYERVKEE